LYLPLIIFFFLPFTKFIKVIAIVIGKVTITVIAIVIGIVTITVIAIETLVEITK
jgi:hypothetical protein